jgi:hypothetical protein
MLSLVVYIPESHLESVKEAMFKAGAGRLGKYDQCCWQTEGKGQFRPMEGADPHTGKVGKLETVKEWKVEMVCERDKLGAAIKALKSAHPYETAAFHVTETLPV